MASIVIKAVRVRGNRAPKEPGGLDGILFICQNGKDKVAVVYMTQSGLNLKPGDAIPSNDPQIAKYAYTSQFYALFFPKKVHKDLTDDDLIKRYMDGYPKWSVIQDPYDPNVIPPDGNTAPANTTAASTAPASSKTFTPDTTLSQESDFLKRANIKPQVDSGAISVKSYTFGIQNPKNDEEKSTKVIIWVIDTEASTYVKNLNPDLRRDYTGDQPISPNSNTILPLPTEGNYFALSKFTNHPQTNPKDNKPITKKPQEFAIGGVTHLSLLAEKQSKTSLYKGPLNNVNDYIAYILWNLRYEYQTSIYGVVATSDADLPKFDLAENKVEFVQVEQQPEPEPKPDVNVVSEIQPVVSNEPDFDDKVYNFNVKDPKFLVNAELGTFSVVTYNVEVQFVDEDENIPLDDEYIETDFFGSEQLSTELQIVRENYTSEEVNKNLKEEDKIADENVVEGGATVLGNDADFWALIAVCSLEDGDDQSRADVAQALYNRLGSKAYGGSSLKALITAKWQFEPAFRKSPRDGEVAQEWKSINSKATAIKALQYSKGWSSETATNALKKCFDALKNPDLQKNAKSFLAGRTDFLSENQGTPEKRNKSNPGRKAIMRSTGRPNNVFAWNYNYKRNTSYDPPAQSWFNKYANQF